MEGCLGAMNLAYHPTIHEPGLSPNNEEDGMGQCCVCPPPKGLWYQFSQSALVYIIEMKRAVQDICLTTSQCLRHWSFAVSQIRELEDRKKIATLLSISGMTESEVSYFMKEPPAKAIVQQKLPKKLQNELAAAKNNQGMSEVVI